MKFRIEYTDTFAGEANYFMDPARHDRSAGNGNGHGAYEARKKGAWLVGRARPA